MNRSYFVFEDLEDATDTKIHLSTCSHVTNRSEAPTTQWFGPFSTHEKAIGEAERIAASKTHGFRDAGCCLS